MLVQAIKPTDHTAPTCVTIVYNPLNNISPDRAAYLLDKAREALCSSKLAI